MLCLQYDAIQSALKDYAETAIQFGYIALFISALPAAGLGGLIANSIEIKVDAWKLLTVHQRPVPRGAEDIGMWQSIFTLIAVAAVVTNAGLATFTMDVLNDRTDSFRFWFFVSFQWTCFMIQVYSPPACTCTHHKLTY